MGKKHITWPMTVYILSMISFDIIELDGYSLMCFISLLINISAIPV